MLQVKKVGCKVLLSLENEKKKTLHTITDTNLSYPLNIACHRCSTAEWIDNKPHSAQSYLGCVEIWMHFFLMALLTQLGHTI